MLQLIAYVIEHNLILINSNNIKSTLFISYYSRHNHVKCVVLHIELCFDKNVVDGCQIIVLLRAETL